MAISRLKKENRNSKGTNESSVSIPLYKSSVFNGPQTRYGNNRWEVYSPKLKRNLTLYSNLEYDHWVLIESDPKVLFFCEQPLKIKIKLPIGVVTTIFDMWIQWESGLEEFREIKFDKELDHSPHNSRVNRQIQAQKKWCELNNKHYSVITEKSIRSNSIYLSNLKLILRHLDRENNKHKESVSERIISMLSQEGASSVGEIENSFSDVESSTVKSIVFELIYKGKLKSDLENKSLDMNSLVEVADA